MSHFDNLPKRGRNHAIEDKAEAAFKMRLSESEVFILQSADHKDYGTDCQIEIVDQDRATNVRIHVQLKGTERALNADGSISVEISRANLNYLLMHPHSFYACYHVPTQSLRICFAEAILRQYEHGGSNWTEQQTLTATFSEALTVDGLKMVAALARSAAASSRDRRADQVVVPVAELSALLQNTVPEVHVPEDPQMASQMLEHLYESGADDIISAAFERFAFVLGSESDAMGPAYMAEVNLGMANRNQYRARIEAAVDHFRAKLAGGRYQPGSLLYTIGNGFSALGDEERAKTSYEAALTDPDFMAVPGLAAQAFKNLGTSLEWLGDEEGSVALYRKALRLSPDLPEAHCALGNYYHRIGKYDDALAHFDRAVFVNRQLARSAAVAGWRVNILFNLDDGRAAFREINSLLIYAESEPWIWPWCARQVASFGRATVDNAAQALSFWQRYVNVYPDVSPARRELLLAYFYLRNAGHDIGMNYAEFRGEFDKHIVHIVDNEAALTWDRLGHWAQDEGDWPEAERCFRKAYTLEGGHFGYCLGTALNFLSRFEESLPILLEQAQTIQADAMSWFQVGAAYSGLGQSDEAIDAYRKAIALDPDYDLAMFNLGGVYWNRGDLIEAAIVWSEAVDKFPDHALSAKLKNEMPFLFN